MRKRILITGGFGYLGGRIATHLAEQNHIIRLGSRVLKNAPEWLSSAETTVIDLFDTASMAIAMADVDIVIHLAAMNENDCVADPAKAVLINTLGTRNALDASIQAGVKQFIYFSTAHVYGAPLEGHITEQTLPRPIHPYAITHHGAEDFVMAAHDQKKIIGIVIRLSNGFGAPTHAGVDRWTLLVNDLCRQLVHTGKITLRSSGLQKRDFVTLGDVGRAMAHIMQLDPPELGNGLFNLGGKTTCLSVWDITQTIAERCKEILGFYPEIIRPEPDKNEIVNELEFDVNKFENTGFSWKGNMNQEIDETLRLAAKHFR